MDIVLEDAIPSWRRYAVISSVRKTGNPPPGRLYWKTLFFFLPSLDMSVLLTDGNISNVVVIVNGSTV